ncbi:MAG: rod shape-determining protein MreC [Candidatus Paracaedibacter sp.]|jgi:rod shape-determining protein MreC
MNKFVPIGLKTLVLRRQTLRYAFLSHARPSLGHPHFSIGIFSCLIGALIIFTLSLRDNKAVHHLNAALLDITMPIVDVVTQPFTALTSWSDLLRTHESLRTEVATLRQENENFLILIQSLRQKTLDHHQLQQLTKVLPDPAIERVSARVIGRVSDGMNALLTIRAIEKDGITKDQPVITADGIVGRVSDVGGFSTATARVMPITDLSSRIPVEIESTQDHGVIAGQNGPELRLIHLEKSAKVKVGDRLVTSGYGGIFPRGLPVAVVTQVTADTITARPFVKETPAFVTVLFGL